MPTTTPKLRPLPVEIFSMQAAVHGYPSVMWRGDVPGVRDENPAVTNNKLFRFFNVVDEEDVDRLRDIGYKLPSLSTSDIIHWSGVTYRVAMIGFEQITGNPTELLRGSR